MSCQTEVPSDQVSIQLVMNQSRTTYHMDPGPVIPRVIFPFIVMISAFPFVKHDIPKVVPLNNLLLVNVDRPGRDRSPVEIPSLLYGFGLVVAGLIDERCYRMWTRTSVARFKMVKEMVGGIRGGRIRQVQVMSVGLPIEPCDVLKVMRTERCAIFFRRSLMRVISMQVWRKER